jgi:hypothetical protein
MYSYEHSSFLNSVCRRACTPFPYWTHTYLTEHQHTVPNWTLTYTYLTKYQHALLNTNIQYLIEHCLALREPGLENIGSGYAFYVYGGNRPLAPILRQRQCSLLYDVYWLAWWWLMFNRIEIPGIQFQNQENERWNNAPTYITKH